MRIVPSLIAVALLAGCATSSNWNHPLRGDYPALTPQDAGSGAYTGTHVRWGGRVVRVEARTDTTCFEMAGTQLSEAGRPLWAPQVPWGRFIACRRGFYDPAQFTTERDVTFVGAIDGIEERQLNGAVYRFPRVAADIVYLWPQPQVQPTRASPWPWWGYWGF